MKVEGEVEGDGTQMKHLCIAQWLTLADNYIINSVPKKVTILRVR